MRTVYLDKGATVTLEITADDNGYFFTTIFAGQSGEPKFLFRPTRTYEEMRNRIQIFVEEGYEPDYYESIPNNSNKAVSVLRIPSITDPTFRRIGNTQQCTTIVDADNAGVDASTLGAYINIPPAQ